MENKIIIFLKNMWTTSVVPTIQALNRHNKENADRIEKAIREKKNATDLSVNNTADISDPIVEAQKATTEAIKAIQPTVIPEVDLSSLEAKMEAFLKALEKKDMTVNIGKTNVEVDTKAVVKAIEKMHSEMKSMKPEEATDYTLMLDEMMKIMERPKDDKHEKMMCELMEKMAKTEDISVIAEWLKVIAEKEAEQVPFKFDKEGRLEVKVDRAGGGGGGGGLTRIETDALVNLESKAATEETQQSVLAAVQGLGGSTYNFIQSDEGATYEYYGFASSTGWRIKRMTVATEVWKIAEGEGDYDTAFADKANKTYNYV